jgi:hypothetical protein
VVENISFRHLMAPADAQAQQTGTPDSRLRWPRVWGVGRADRTSAAAASCPHLESWPRPTARSSVYAAISCFPSRTPALNCGLRGSD